MSGGLVALLDDVAVLARAAAASADDIGAAAARAGAKTAGVVVDDAAVTPQYVRGLAAARELPIIRRIAIGSVRNKMLLILPVVLLLSQFLPVLLTPLLMVGGTYLCFEGAEKVWGRLRGHGPAAAAVEELPDEDVIVAGAVRTDLILSAEIMVISLEEVVDEPFLSRAIILAVVGLAVTVVVYGAVAVLVKVDDAGLRLAQLPSAGVARLGRAMVTALPRVLTALTVVGTSAMLWVGGHILLLGAEELGLAAPYDLVHHAEEAVASAAGGAGSVAGWLVGTLASALLGLLVGLLVVAVVHAVGAARHRHREDDGAPQHR